MANRNCLIAVHAGAGYHSQSRTDSYEVLCARACSQAVAVMNSGCSSIRAVAEAIKVLEDSDITNAGYGSNLTISGSVECDATVMDGSSMYFGSVGALSGMKNPVLVAEKLLTEQTSGLLSLGRIRPSVLVGDGARHWAISNGFSPIHSQQMVSVHSQRAYRNHMKKLDEVESSKKRLKSEPVDEVLDVKISAPLDTVGAVAMDCHGHVAAAISSGGIALKHPGRVGQAALYACGCWAQDGREGRDSVAVSTSGCGEYIIKTVLAKECADVLGCSSDTSTDLSNVITNKFLHAQSLEAVQDDKLVGVLALKSKPPQSEAVEGKYEAELLWVHTTKSMCIGCMSGDDELPFVEISRLPESCLAGQTVAIGGRLFSL